MNPLQEQRIRLWNAELSGDIPLNLVLTNDKRSDDFRRFCDELSQAAPGIRILEKTDRDAELPSIRIGENLHYYAIPADAELEPFLEAVAAFGQGSAQIPEAVQSNFEKIDAPALLRLYITLQCPLCPWRVRQITPLAILNKLLQLEIIDAALFPALADKDSVQSVPTLILDGDFRWTSTTPLEEVVEILATRDPSAMRAPAIEEMLQIGNAEKVAQMMLKKGQIFPSFPGFLADEKFSTRLGAMVAAEEIARQNPALASLIVLPLWELFERAGGSVKEDIIYVLGVSGNDQTVPMLEAVLNDHCSSELKESAGEAIEKIKARNSHPLI